MKAIAMEFYKIRHRQVWLIVAFMLGIQLLWALWSFSRMDTLDLKQGWQFCLSHFPIVNAIMMPVIAAVVASRISDIEHKGNTIKLLKTVMPAGSLFDAKFICGSSYMLAAVLLQFVMSVISGYLKGFAGAPPISRLGFYFLFTAAVTLTILLLQQVLSLLFVNQMIPFTIGLTGGFAGLFSLFFPQALEKFVLWGYYGVLMFVRLDWHPATRVANYYWSPVDWSGFITLIAVFCVIYMIGRSLFVRKEI